MKLFNLFITALLSLFCFVLHANVNKPYCLLTDLVKHTDYTWQNGYVSNVPVWQMENAIESLQYVEIGSAYPSFSWIVSGEANATYQTSYRIIVADNMKDAISEKGNIWDSGVVESRKSTSVLYAGKALQPEKNYFWRVKTITNTEGESDWSDVKAFRTAKKMLDYAAGFYPQVKSLEHPVLMNKVIDFIHTRKMACSVYGSQFLMDALYDASDAEYALSMLTKTDDRSWYNMIRTGSTISLEAWDNKYKPNQDWNHSWGAAPANIIPRKLVGVEPLMSGFDKVRIKPQIASLSWIKAIIPTIKGDIYMEIENKKGEYKLQITTPANMECEVYLPLLSKKYEVHNNGVIQKTARLKNEPFVSFGNLLSGKYTIMMKY